MGPYICVSVHNHFLEIIDMLLDHPGRVTLKTEELFCCLVLSSTIESREGRVILRLVS